jgi:putative ubiquitin-RnfH superfamily antitoxin RatB of RatAB toxin-antitoxin module
MQMFVKVAQLGGKVQEVLLETGATVEDALVAAGVENFEDAEIKINKRAVQLEDEVFGDEVVIIVPKIEGGL